MKLLAIIDQALYWLCDNWLGFVDLCLTVFTALVVFQMRRRGVASLRLPKLSNRLGDEISKLSQYLNDLDAHRFEVGDSMIRLYSIVKSIKKNLPVNTAKELVGDLPFVLQHFDSDNASLDELSGLRSKLYRIDSELSEYLEQKKVKELFQ